MWEIFKTVLYLSLIGSGFTAVLTAVKPLTVKHLPARWQYYIWLTVSLCMLMPFWRFIPQQQVRSLTHQLIPAQTIQTPSVVPSASIPDSGSVPFSGEKILSDSGADIHDIIAYVWLCGMVIFLIAAAVSYVIFLFKKRGGSIALESSAQLDEVKSELNIKRRIRVRLSCDNDSPMLVGALFPVVYVPANTDDLAYQKMIFRHELTHYKHGDLFYKWLSLFVNAVHWFNPFAYILSANVNQSCEVACDMSVIKSMDDDERQLYMETILDTVENSI